MNRKTDESSNKLILIILTLVCAAAIVLTGTDIVSVSPIRKVASYVIVPMQKGINSIGRWLTDRKDYFGKANELNDRIKELEQQVADLQEENLVLSENQSELKRLRELYALDAGYYEYDKVAANVIFKDPGNWYSSFIIDKGSNDGLEINMNVISQGGLVGLVTDVGADWATVRAIIDDSNSVSAMTLSRNDTCIVTGDLVLLDDGLLAFSQMNTANTVTEGERIVTSNISDKYLPGILIGTISEINDDTNHLTKTGYIIPVVNFKNIREVLVIKTLKQNVKD